MYCSCLVPYLQWFVSNDTQCDINYCINNVITDKNSKD